MLRILLVAIFSLVVLNNSLLLTVSLPRGQLQPQNRFLRYFFISSERIHRLIVAIYEAIFAIGLLLEAFADDALPLAAFLIPAFVLAAPPLAKVMLRECRLCNVECLKTFGKLFLLFLLSPIWMPCYLVYGIWAHRHDWFHPLSAGSHILLEVVSLILLLVLRSPDYASVMGLSCLSCFVGPPGSIFGETLSLAQRSSVGLNRVHRVAYVLCSSSHSKSYLRRWKHEGDTVRCSLGTCNKRINVGTTLGRFARKCGTGLPRLATTPWDISC